MQIIKKSIEYIKQLKKPSVADLLIKADQSKNMLFQPRCGVGDHILMMELLHQIYEVAKPEILSITIDSHTRLKHFDKALTLMEKTPDKLNGYPLVAHGWKRCRELNESTKAPLQIRHGSPDPITLFNISLLGGVTAFEGGGISYNLPYCKNVPLKDSLDAWEYVDIVCGELAQEGILVDREMFGSLTGVLMPPSISIAISILEGLLAASKGVKCISIAYPQGGNIYQDVAAMRCIRQLCTKYFPADVKSFPVLHQYMGPFPADITKADALILLGALTGKLAGAVKVITKTNHESYGVPTAEANAQGILTSRTVTNNLFDSIILDESIILTEMDWIKKEVNELILPILQFADLKKAIIEAFEYGRLDIPFSASRYAKSDIIPIRDSTGAIRYGLTGNLSFSKEVQKKNKELIKDVLKNRTIFQTVKSDITYFI